MFVLPVVMGVGGSCIAIHYTLEHVKAEQTVDIFQSIKNSCICQTSLISNVVSETVKLVSVPSHFLNFYKWYKLYYNSQTLSCYYYRSIAVLEFLDEFLAYLNFKLLLY